MTRVIWVVRFQAPTDRGLVPLSMEFSNLLDVEPYLKCISREGAVHIRVTREEQCLCPACRQGLRSQCEAGGSELS